MGCVQMNGRTRWAAAISAAVGMMTMTAMIGCAADRPQRTALAAIDTQTGFPTNAECRQQWDTPDDGQEQADTASRCALQRHGQHPAADTTGIKAGGGYHLAFLEFGEDGGFAADPDPRSLHARQLADLRRHLAAQPQTYLITYVHGWRHDARAGDADVRDLQLLAAYARSFLDQRCRKTGRYCKAEVTALYVGWRGASVDESLGAITKPAAILSFVTRKPQSETVAPFVIDALRLIETDLRDQDRKAGRTGIDRNRMLVLGHSAGGNLLLSGLLDDPSGQTVEKAIAAQVPGAPLEAPLGDLVVLLNPAAESTKWARIQNAVHRREAALDLADCQNQSRTQPLFPLNQPPVLIAMTSTCGLTSGGKDTSPFCDWVTDTVFPIYRSALGKGNDRDRRTLGHMDQLPSDAPGMPPGRLVGTTHQFDINHTITDNTGKYIPTRIANAGNPTLSRCDVVDGWLLRARKLKGGPSAEGWDAGYSVQSGRQGRNSPHPNLTPINAEFNPPGKVPRRLESQFRHGLSQDLPLRLRLKDRQVTKGTDPFWNVAAHVGAILEHSGYVSYMTWCAINQLVLDDITGG